MPAQTHLDLAVHGTREQEVARDREEADGADTLKREGSEG